MVASNTSTAMAMIDFFLMMHKRTMVRGRMLLVFFELHVGVTNCWIGAMKGSVPSVSSGDLFFTTEGTEGTEKEKGTGRLAACASSKAGR